MGLLALLLFGYLIWLGLFQLDRPGLLGTYTAGVVGSVVSVMWRMNSGKFTLPPKLGRLQTVALGVTRPCLGAVSAAVLFIFLLSGLLPFELDVTPDTRIYFFSAIGFVAGFSEQFMKDVFGKAEASARSVTGVEKIEAKEDSSNENGRGTYEFKAIADFRAG